MWINYAVFCVAQVCANWKDAIMQLAEHATFIPEHASPGEQIEVPADCAYKEPYKYWMENAITIASVIVHTNQHLHQRNYLKSYIVCAKLNFNPTKLQLGKCFTKLVEKSRRKVVINSRWWIVLKTKIIYMSFQSILNTLVCLFPYYCPLSLHILIQIGIMIFLYL